MSLPIKKQQPPADGDENGWLVSYADMMTLIACFFILMMAFANYDPPGFNKKAEEFSKAISGEKYKSSEIKLEEISEEIAKHPELKTKAKLSIVDSELIITFSSSILFEPKQLTLSNAVLSSLDTMIDIIRTKDPSYKVMIEGHTDSTEYKEIQHVTSAWDLGALRASQVVSRFEYYGFNPKKLVAITKGDSEPLAPNFDEDGNPIEENLYANRRVIIKVLEPKDKNQKVKFGFGTYFND